MPPKKISKALSSSKKDNVCMTLTFSKSGENHVGNQVVGNKSHRGFEVKHLQHTKIILNDLSVGVETDVDDAYVGVVKDFFIDMHDELLDELVSLPWDSKYLSRGRVVNKHARHNLVFSWFDQEAEYEEGKGTVVDIQGLPYLLAFVKRVVDFMNKIGYKVSKEELVVEGNLYYDPSCYIGFHGDSERSLVLGARLGHFDLPLHYGWWKHQRFVKGSMKSCKIKAGSIYLMSEKAVGTDWKKHAGGLMTLRHAAGDPEVLKKLGQWHE